MLPDTAFLDPEQHIVGRAPRLTHTRSVRLSSGMGLSATAPVRFAKEALTGQKASTPKRRQTGYREQTASVASLADFRQLSVEVRQMPPRGDGSSLVPCMLTAVHWTAH